MRCHLILNASFQSVKLHIVMAACSLSKPSFKISDYKPMKLKMLKTLFE